LAKNTTLQFVRSAKKAIADGSPAQSALEEWQRSNAQALAEVDAEILRFERNPALLAQEQLSRALLKKATLLGKIGPAIAEIETLVARLERNLKASRRRQITDARRAKLQESELYKQFEWSLSIFGETFERFATADAASLRKHAIDALALKAETLRSAARVAEAIETYELLAARFGADPDAGIQRVVADSLLEKGDLLNSTGSTQGASRSYEEVIRLFGKNAANGELRGLIATAVIKIAVISHQSANKAVSEGADAIRHVIDGAIEAFFRTPQSNEKQEYQHYGKDESISPGANDVVEPLDPPTRGGIMEIKGKKTDDAKWSKLLDQIQNEIGLVEAANLILGRASPEDRALIASMALPEHEDIFQAIAAAKKEFVERRCDFSKPPLPKLSAKQIVAIKKRAKEQPWAERKDDDKRNPFEWVRDTYRPWAGKGLLQSHLAADQELYGAFSRRVLRKRLPDWLDVPNESDAIMRQIADPAEQLRTLISRHLQVTRARLIRSL
jgi:hypothetical protein